MCVPGWLLYCPLGTELWDPIVCRYASPVDSGHVKFHLDNAGDDDVKAVARRAAEDIGIVASKLIGVAPSSELSAELISWIPVDENGAVDMARAVYGEQHVWILSARFRA